MALSTYTSYLIVSKDVNTSLNRVASQAMVKRDTEYYQANIGNVTSVDEFMADYRLYSYATKAYGLEDMTYAKAFIRKVLESDLTDSNSFANKLTDKRYQEFAAAFNFTGGTRAAQSGAQEADLLAAYEASFSAQEAGINAETSYYDTTIDAITSVDGLVNNSRLMSYVLKANGVYSDYYSQDKLRQFLTSDMDDPSSYANVEYVQKRATLLQDNSDMQQITSVISSRNTLVNANANIDAQLNNPDSTLTAEQRQQLEATRAANQQTIAGYDSTLQSAVGTTDTAELAAIRSRYSAAISENTRLVGVIDSFLALKEQFSFNADGSLAGATAQTAEQKEAVTTAYLQNVSTGPSYTLFTANKAHYEQVIANATTVDDLVNDARVVEYIKTAYGISAITDASTLRGMLLSDPDNSGSAAAIKGFQDFPRLFNFNSDGTVKSGMTAQSNETITYTNARGVEVTVNPLADSASRYRANYLTAFQDDIDVAMENYEKRIDAVQSVDDLFTTNTSYWQSNSVQSSDYATYSKQPELWQMALDAFGVDSTKYSEHKLRRILTSDLDDPKSYVYSFKDENLVKFAKAFNFDTQGNIDVPQQAQSEQVVNDLTSEYKSRMVRFLSGKEAETAAEKADAEIGYYKEQVARITTVDELLADSRLVNVMLQSRGIDPTSVTTADLKKMFLSDLSDPKSFVNQQDNRELAELVASFNFDSEGNLTQDKDVIGTVQQRGDVIETINLYVRQTLEENEGNASEGVRLALYFQRKAPDITTAYNFLADTALTQFFTTAFSLSDYFSSMDVDRQKEMVERMVDVKRLGDPDYVRTLVQRYTALYDAANNTVSSAALTLLTS
ncbi:DUF1217 domain-containing protein [Rhizobiaceae bacterium BDR2-2]|uniref:DUF1217 domain-containing protein n=1 Tax=Ectorhizobium quercum TaxID=2965071 RepID=A0AAE3MZ50_9HYPH|nr:DUF1217 domain-containing protein [Ectorhizobium quercum]MCX8996345.1 DUF1217 domain-containing protein [Ectorhizobium quercum]MCX8998616.1 DUF1217 domain-containing protein [Ectorhizobium quercum]